MSETVSAAADSDEDASFGGTSSASPRTAGYAAKLLLETRKHFAITTGMSGDKLIVLPATVPPPASGPLADGDLTAAELHEVIGGVSERTLPMALDVLRGITAMPERPVEDAWYERSEALRSALWG